VNSPQGFFQSAGYKRNLAVTGVMLVILLFAIDATIVATSMPTIVSQLGGLELYSWVFSIYMLTSALTTPIFGKLADLFSRRRLMLIGIGIFLVGSMLCGAAQSMEAMVLFRAIQGLGGGAIYALSFIVVGVLYAAEMRAKMQGIITGIWGLAAILGPLAGGIIVENWNWRWIFFVNLPLVAIATVLIVVGLKEEKRETQTPKLDLWGAATLLSGLLLIFYALAQTAHTLHPLSTETVLMIVLGLAILAIFVAIERRAPEPIMPMDLFRLPLYRSSVAIATLCSMGVFGAISYLPLYLQGVLGIAASYAGMVLVSLSLGWTAGSLLAGRWINRSGYRIVAAAGMALLVWGYGIFVVPYVSAGIVAVVTSSIAIGMGMGVANLTSLIAAQSSVLSSRIGVATSTIMLFRTFGGAFAVSLMGTVLLSQMQRSLTQIKAGKTAVPAEVWNKLANPQNLLEPATRAQIPPEILPQLVAALGDAIWYAFFTGFIVMLIGLATSFLMPSYTPVSTPKPSGK
jgi:EmrB/QacA subfamily drug resistance transporter